MQYHHIGISHTARLERILIGTRTENTIGGHRVPSKRLSEDEAQIIVVIARIAFINVGYALAASMLQCCSTFNQSEKAS